MLLLLVSSQRGLTIYLLDINHMFVSGEKHSFVIPKYLKQIKPRIPNPQVVLEPYKQYFECLVTTLKEYLVRTKTLRESNQSQLLISYVQPH